MAKRNAIIIGFYIILVVLVVSVSGLVHFKKPQTSEIENAVTSSTDVNQYSKSEFMEIKKNYNVFEKDVEEFVYYAPKSSMDGSEILILKFKDPKMASIVAKKVEDRKIKRIDMYKSYRPEEAQILENSITDIKGNYLIFAASRDIKAIKTSIDKVFK